MAGIVKIRCSKVCFFPAVQTTQKLAHRFFVTLRPVDNVVNSGTEFSTFNPFVVGSTPAGPTKSKSTLNFDSKCFFLACARFHSPSCPGWHPPIMPRQRANPAAPKVRRRMRRQGALGTRSSGCGFFQLGGQF